MSRGLLKVENPVAAPLPFRCEIEQLCQVFSGSHHHVNLLSDFRSGVAD